jgi:hypothetical protein
MDHCDPLLTQCAGQDSLPGVLLERMIQLQHSCVIPALSLRITLVLVGLYPPSWALDQGTKKPIGEGGKYNTIILLLQQRKITGRQTRHSHPRSPKS